MANEIDMSTPVTRAELKEELQRFPTKADLKAALKKELERFVTKAELKKELERFATKAELKKELERFATRVDLEVWGGALYERILESERRLLKELASLASAHQEEIMRMIVVIDDKYKDLPDRMRRVEAVVFPGEQR